MYSVWFIVLCAILKCATVEITECNTKFSDFMENYKKCFTSNQAILTKPLFYKLQELYNKEITEEDFVQYKVQNCPRLHNGIDCVLAIDVTEDVEKCEAVAGILNRFREEKVSFGYICDLDNQQFLDALSNGGIKCLFAQETLGICMKNKTKTYDGVIDRCEALKIKKECLEMDEVACTNSNVDIHISAIIDALRTDKKCEN